MQCKMLFTGSIRISDTHLLADLKEKFDESLFVIPDVSHDLLPMQPERLQYLDLLNALFSEQVQRETEAMASGSSHIICDRGAVDILAYATLFHIPHKQEWLEWSKYSYDLIFCLDDSDAHTLKAPAQAQVVDKDLRAFRIHLDSAINQTLQLLGLSWQKLSGDREEQIKMVETAVATN